MTLRFTFGSDRPILCLMYSPVLSVLFLGMIPLAGTPPANPVPTLQNIEVAPPSIEIQIPQTLSASGVLILDLRTGQKLFGVAEETERPMASLTKLMTALIIAENHALDEWVTVPHSAAQAEGNTVYLPEGQHFTVSALLSAVLIQSANDAAEALAVYHSGSIPAFVEEMNRRAAALGLSHTSFANPSGIDDENQFSTPRDLAWLTLAALRVQSIAERMGKTSANIGSREGTPIHLTHTHMLLHDDSSVVAGKTGTTLGAGQCLISVVQEGGREYIVVLLNSSERYADMRAILRTLSPPVITADLDI